MRFKKDLSLLLLTSCALIFMYVTSPDDVTTPIIGTLERLTHWSKDAQNTDDDTAPNMTSSSVGHHVKHPVFTPSNMYVYWPPSPSKMTRPGRKFTVDIRIAKKIKDMSKHFFVLNDQTVDKFVFVTAASVNHFEESMDAVASVQHHFPGKRIFYYDLGLRNIQIDTVLSWKGVEYRLFDFSMYPAYFQENLRKVGWKPIIIQEVMAKYGAVFWFDASIRFTSGNMTRIYEAVTRNGGIMLFKTTKSSNFAATHKLTYDFFPTDRERQTRTPMLIATTILAYNTKTMFYNVLWWFFICALQEECQAPMEKTMCDFDMDNKWENFAKCHKWDQSTLNILLSNFYGYRSKNYMSPDEILVVERWPTNRYNIQTNPEE